ncbi:MAG: glycosyltransferase family 4 protein [Muribaculaceae bacterium]|nr:glycosyltransferase family 4 protein [Muribaculaceae bacterium]
MTREPRHSPTVLDMRQQEISHSSDNLSSYSRTGRGLDPNFRGSGPVFGYHYLYKNIHVDILVLTPCLLNGGTEVQLLSLCQAFQSIGKKVAIACLFEYSQSMVTAFEDLNLQVYCLSKTSSRPKGIIPTIYRVGISLWRLSRKLKVKKVHIAYMAPGAMSVFFAKVLLSCKVYVSVHACCSSPPSAYLLHFLTRIFFIRRVIFVSEATAVSFHRSASNKLSSRYTVVTNALPKVIGLCFKSSDFIHKRLCIGWVGRLELIKGSDILKWIIYRREILDLPIDWLIAGEGSELTSIRELVRSHNLENRIKICGNIPHHSITSVYDTIDILFVPSRKEAFGLSALEGMARGCVLIASKASGLNELLSNSHAAIQFDINRPHDAVEAIRFLCENRVKLYTMSKCATKHAARFTYTAYEKSIIKAHS